MIFSKNSSSFIQKYPVKEAFWSLFLPIWQVKLEAFEIESLHIFTSSEHYTNSVTKTPHLISVMDDYHNGK
jgi:hypothetical protein